MSRPLAAIDKNLDSCRAGLAATTSLAQRDLIKSLIDDLLAERQTCNSHCTLCGGAGRMLPGGACSLCDRRRCMTKNAQGEIICTEYVENVRASKCPRGHLLP